MAVTYRTDGAWGSGKGANLTPAEVDGNFYDVDSRVSTIEDNPVEPIAPIAINIEGSAFTMGLSNGDTLGPVAITYPMPTWRGNWAPATTYNEMDFFIAPDNGLGAVMVPHVSAATFDWTAIDSVTTLAVYRELIGGSGSSLTLDGLTDVTITTPATGQVLSYDGASGFWHNTTTGTGAGTVTSVATAAGLTGGPVTTSGTIALADIANQRVFANVSGGSAPPSANTMTAILDAVFSTTRGSLLYRGSGGWAALAPGTSGNVLTTGGTSADPAWAPAAGGGASISIGDTPPTLTAGALWWDSVGGQGYIGYNDGTSTQWASFSNQPGPTGATGPAGPGISGTAGAIPYFNTSTTIADSVMFQTGGNVGIGTAAPGSKLDVQGTGTNAFPVRVRAGTNMGTAGQSVGVEFYESSGAAAVGRVSSVSESASDIGLGFLTFSSSLVERVRITGAGGVIVGTPAGGSKGVGTINAVSVYGNNVLLTSDAELKTDIEPLTQALPILAAIEPKSFKWKPLPDMEGPDGEMASPMPPGFADTLNRGFLAQDVAKVLGGDVTGVDLGGMVAILWQAVRELQDEVNELKGKKPTPRGRH